MNKHLLKLAKRREHLLIKAEAQRLSLAANLDVWRKPLSVADHGLNILRYVRNHPFMMAGGASALFSILPANRYAKWLQRSLLAWQILKKLKNKPKA